MRLPELLPSLCSLEDLPSLSAALGCEPLWDPVPGGPVPTVVVGRAADFVWYALSGARAEQRAQAFARRVGARGRLVGVMGLDVEARRLTLVVSLDGAARLSLDLDSPNRSAVAALERMASGGYGGPAGYAAHVAAALGGEAVGHRFFRAFRTTLDRMAAGLPGPMPAADRHALALLQLTRVLFLYFVQAKGWLAGNRRFLAESVDRCLAKKRRVHRDLLGLLFFGTLNRPLAERSRTALSLGPVPFLNGGLFEPHPLERRARGAIPDELWRDAFDGLFERFHFTVGEGEPGSIAPDMLGHVFEGVMEPDQRRASGTYYTPAALVRRMLREGLAAIVAGRLGRSQAEAEKRLDEGDEAACRALESLRILDPAVGSGAFLLGALDLLSSTDRMRAHQAGIRRRILRRMLFGVDRNAAAVRLTELRLWLSVIADDPADQPELVRPLPNLDCLIRQGDTLFDATGLARRPNIDRRRVQALASARRRVVTASGGAKRLALGELVRAEAGIANESLAGAEEGLRASIAELVQEARGVDLFGHRRGCDRGRSAHLAELRRELRSVRSLRRSLSREREVPWFDYRIHFADVFAGGGFDLVVGNPPWVRSEHLPADLRRRLAGRYRWWRASGGGYANRPDLAVAFLERSLELTAPGGVVAMLVPAKIAFAGYGATVRHALSASTTIVSAADLTRSSHAAFDATVYPLALVLRKAEPAAGHRVRLSLGEGPTMPQAALRGGTPWLLGRHSPRQALSELRRGHPRMDETVRCHLGLKTGANDVFLDPPEVEPDMLRWALRGRDLKPFSAKPRTRLLWTHARDGTPLPRLPPRAAAYLAPLIGRLRSRADFVEGPPWSLFRTRAAIAPHRVAWADLASDLRAASLSGQPDTIPLNSCYVAVLRSDEEADRLAAWLNSSVVRAAAKAGAMPAAGGCFRFSAATIGGLPLPIGVLEDADLSSLTRLAVAGKQVQAELDEATARHFDLSPKHRDSILESLACAANRR